MLVSNNSSFGQLHASPVRKSSTCLDCGVRFSVWRRPLVCLECVGTFCNNCCVPSPYGLEKESYETNTTTTKLCRSCLYDIQGGSDSSYADPKRSKSVDSQSNHASLGPTNARANEQNNTVRKNQLITRRSSSVGSTNYSTNIVDMEMSLEDTIEKQRRIGIAIALSESERHRRLRERQSSAPSICREDILRNLSVLEDTERSRRAKFLRNEKDQEYDKYERFWAISHAIALCEEERLRRVLERSCSSDSYTQNRDLNRNLAAKLLEEEKASRVGELLISDANEDRRRARESQIILGSVRQKTLAEANRRIRLGTSGDVVKWIPDEYRSVCVAKHCSTHFGFWNRRHHCRACGEIFCSSCSDNFLQLHPLSRFKARVCDGCAPIVEFHRQHI